MARAITVVLMLLLATALAIWLTRGEVEEPFTLVIHKSGTAGDEVKWTERTLTVMAVNRETGAPVPDAEVLWCDGWNRYDHSPEGRAALELLMKDAEAFCRQAGHVARTDAQGMVAIPSQSSFFGIAVRHGDLYGEYQSDVDGEIPGDEVRILLSQDLNVDVNVTDAHGRPAPGIAVGAILRSDKKHNSKDHWPVGSITSEAGHARFRHLQKLIHRCGENSEMPPRFDFYCEIPGYRSPAKSLSFRELQQGPAPLRLQLPPTGKVKLLLHDRTGRPLAGHWVFLNTLPDNGRQKDAVDQPKVSWLRDTWSGRTGSDGSHTFSYLAPGIRYQVGADFFWIDRKDTSAPVAVEATTPLTIVAPEDLAFLSGRAVDMDGNTLGRRGLEVSFGSGKDMDEEHLETDSDGRFVLYLTQEQVVGELRMILHGKSAKPEGLTCTRGHPARLQPGENELGDVEFVRSNVVGSGQVLLDGSPPKSSFWWHLELERWESGAGEKGQWQPEEGLHLNMLVKGKFEILGWPTADRLRLLLVSDDHLPVDPIEFSPGAKNIVITARSGAEVRAKVRMDRRESSASIYLELRPAAGHPGAVKPALPDDRAYGNLMQTKGSTMHFIWPSQPAGLFDLLVFLTGRPEPVLKIEAIDLPDHGRVHDPRLASIDLRGKVHRLRIKINDEKAKPASVRGGIFVKPRNPNRPLEGITLHGKEVTFLTTRSSLDLWLITADYLEQELTLASGSTKTVTLEERDEIRVQVMLGSTVLSMLPKDSEGYVQFELAESSSPRRSYVLRHPLGASVPAHVAPYHVGKRYPELSPAPQCQLRDQAIHPQ